MVVRHRVLATGGGTGTAGHDAPLQAPRPTERGRIGRFHGVRLPDVRAVVASLDRTGFTTQIVSGGSPVQSSLRSPPEDFASCRGTRKRGDSCSTRTAFHPGTFSTSTVTVCDGTDSVVLLPGSVGRDIPGRLRRGARGRRRQVRFPGIPHRPGVAPRRAGIAIPQGRALVVRGEDRRLRGSAHHRCPVRPGVPGKREAAPDTTRSVTPAGRPYSFLKSASSSGSFTTRTEHFAFFMISRCSG